MENHKKEKKRKRQADMDNRLDEMEERKPSACVMYAVLFFFYFCYLFITLISILTYMRSVKMSGQEARDSYKL